MVMHRPKAEVDLPSEREVRVTRSFAAPRSREDASQFGFHGEFRKVEALARLEHTEVYEPGDVGGSMGETGMTDGMEASYRNLDALLAEGPQEG